MSQKQKQSTKQSVIVNVKNVINERRRRAKRAPKKETKETRDTVMLQPKASMFGNNLLTGNVSRYVQPAITYAIPQRGFIPIQQSAIVDKPITNPEPPKQRADIFAGEETNPHDIDPSYTPKTTPPKIEFENLPESAIPESLKKMTRPMLFRQIELYGVKPPQSTKKAELEAILQGLLQSQEPISASSSSASASTPKLSVTPSSIRFLETLNVAPRPPMPPTNPEEEKGPAQAVGAPAIRVEEAIEPPKQGKVWTPEGLQDYLEGLGRGDEMQDVFDVFGRLPKYSQRQVLEIIRGGYKK
jgi:hypothetical protein